MRLQESTLSGINPSMMMGMAVVSGVHWNCHEEKNAFLQSVFLEFGTSP
jgi:hypothetical protein